MGSDMAMFVYHRGASYDKALSLCGEKYCTISPRQFPSSIFLLLTIINPPLLMYPWQLSSESIEIQLSVSFQKPAYLWHLGR